MSPEEMDFDLSGGGKSDFVPVVYARGLDDAERYRSLLEDHDIPAMVGTDNDGGDDESVSSSSRRGMPVMVPEVLLDEASEVIADLEDTDEFGPQTDDETEEDEDDDLEFHEPLDETVDGGLDDGDDLLDDDVEADADDESGLY